MKASNIDNKGKIKKNKDILPGDCIFPFKYKGQSYNNCVQGNTGNWCATSLTNRGTTKTWGYCNDKILKKSSKKSISKDSSKKTVRKPRGRPPKGKRWDDKKKKWVDMCWGCLTDQPNQLAHMDPGGCLCQDSESSSISSSQSISKSSSKYSIKKSSSKSFSEKKSQKSSSDSKDMLTFGKHNGKQFSWVYQNDNQYCTWAIEQGPKTPEFERFRKYCQEKDGNNKNIPINELIISELTLLKQKETVLKNWFKVRAYNTAIKTIKDDFNNRPITSGKELEKYKGIGNKIMNKVDEIIREGHLKSADKVREDKDIEIINNFKEGIYGVGVTKAIEIVKKYNIRSLEELIKRQSEITDNGRELLNNVQKKGLKYYDDSLLKIPRKEMEQHDKYLQKISEELGDSITITIAGSYRREMPSSGDIDVLIKNENNDPNTLHRFVNLLKRNGYIVEEYVYGDKKFQGMCKLKGYKHARRLDILFTTVEEYPFALFYFTGSGTFNPKLRQIVMDKGYRLSEQGIYEIDEKKHIKKQIHTDKDGKPFRKEEDIFNFINIPYINPKDRNPEILDKIIIE